MRVQATLNPFRFDNWRQKPVYLTSHIKNRQSFLSPVTLFAQTCSLCKQHLSLLSWNFIIFRVSRCWNKAPVLNTVITEMKEIEIYSKVLMIRSISFPVACICFSYFFVFFFIGKAGSAKSKWELGFEYLPYLSILAIPAFLWAVTSKLRKRSGVNSE